MKPLNSILLAIRNFFLRLASNIIFLSESLHHIGPNSKCCYKFWLFTWCVFDQSFHFPYWVLYCVLLVCSVTDYWSVISVFFSFQLDLYFFFFFQIHLIGIVWGHCSCSLQAVKFISCSRSSISNIIFVDSPQTHISIVRSVGININKVIISAPERSPNTDGIHIHSSSFVNVQYVNVGTGNYLELLCASFSKLPVLSRFIFQ